MTDVEPGITGQRRVALHVAPHPDDETLAAGPTLALLQNAGWHVVNLACGLGRKADHERRAVELSAALSEWGFVDERLDPPSAMSSGDDLVAARVQVASAVVEAMDRHRPALVVSPQPHDGHHGHVVVASAVFDALTGLARAGARMPPWWMWGYWRDLTTPTLYVPYGAQVLARIDRALACYAGEIARNDVSRVPAARGTVGAVVGWERVFGFGTTSRTGMPYADLLTEAVWRAGTWRLGSARVLDPVRPFAEPSELDLASWLDVEATGS